MKVGSETLNAQKENFYLLKVEIFLRHFRLGLGAKDEKFRLSHLCLGLGL